ncbi:histidine kinase N-terminal 7TM domain-containing protein [Halobaculum lipolyticum]|uniref:histidine kinase n=1 Tax=Halobaculum lipolyticum TaxID=3032001 RepID=A0ABD5W928_9EURY|nr:histidine kinase N-terminal 7TM domain-containing protein [Halobaculum sp. DT31]
MSTGAAGAGSAALAWYLDRHRGSAGAGWLMATLSAQAVWALAYTVGLLVSDLTVRAYAEAVAWVGMAWLGPLFLGFALAYTGRSALLRSRGFRLLFAVPVSASLLALTHPLHDWLWLFFRRSPEFGVTTVRYAIQLPGYAALLVSLGTAAVGVLLLVGAISTYGPLYRREATAIALSTLPPATGVVVWLVGVGPWPELNLGAPLLLFHVALDVYAFVGTRLFETAPTTQRAAKRSALDDLAEPLLVLDTEAAVVNMNRRAESLFDVDGTAAVPVPFADLAGATLDDVRSSGELTVDGADGGIFAVSHTPLRDQRGDDVGGLVVLYEVTVERRRKQQLSVLNRILRHNLRNELTVARGNARAIRASATDPAVGTQAGAIVASSERLLATARKAKQFGRIQGRDLDLSVVEVTDLVNDVWRDLRESYPHADVAAEIETDRTRIRTDSTVLSMVVSNLIENAIVHADDAAGVPAPAVVVRITTDPDDRSATVVEVTDENPPIDDAEIDALSAGDETALEHGSGIGLWIVHWCVTALNGRIEFEYDDGNVVRVTLPTHAAAAADERAAVDGRRTPDGPDTPLVDDGVGAPSGGDPAKSDD